MTLLAEIGQAVRGAIGGDVFPPATLHALARGTGGEIPLNDDGQPVRAYADHGTTGFISKWDHKIMAAKGYDPNTAKVVLVQSPTLPKPEINDEVTAQRPITLEQVRYRVIDVSSDPADATWAVAGVPI